MLDCFCLCEPENPTGKKIREWNSFVISLSQKLHPGQKCVAIIWCLLGVALCSARYEKRYLSVKTGESGIVAEWKFYFGQLFSPPALSWRMRHTGAVLWVHRPLFSPSPSSPSFFYLSLGISTFKVNLGTLLDARCAFIAENPNS